jgi:hypothetical protein
VNGAGKIGLAVVMALAFALAPNAGAVELSLIDDFSGETSARGTRWEGFTDRVMGGVSDMDSGVQRKGDEAFLYLRGNVSLKNNGGFIQVRLKLGTDGKPFDASGSAGVALRVRGRGPGYYVHLRTTRTVFPWSFYGQEFTVSEDWSTVLLPFAAFQSENMASSRVDPRKLVSVAIVAAKREFAADLYIDSISWYR